jgi:outer membrane protein TolC
MGPRRIPLSELIDLAEAHNPATRAAWERARSQAALGITRSESPYLKRLGCSFKRCPNVAAIP